mmetsp:Transcript_7091/g.14325  ORF Transcript_7091/g.14325 Transcript_7091/m.14325 type:complete len:216 (+) Transcript_7091:367-1014(+)
MSARVVVLEVVPVARLHELVVLLLLLRARRVPRRLLRAHLPLLLCPPHHLLVLLLSKLFYRHGRQVVSRPEDLPADAVPFTLQPPLEGPRGIPQGGCDHHLLGGGARGLPPLVGRGRGRQNLQLGFDHLKVPQRCGRRHFDAQHPCLAVVFTVVNLASILTLSKILLCALLFGLDGRKPRFNLLVPFEVRYLLHALSICVGWSFPMECLLIQSRE